MGTKNEIYIVRVLIYVKINRIVLKISFIHILINKGTIQLHMGIYGFFELLKVLCHTCLRTYKTVLKIKVEISMLKLMLAKLNYNFSKKKKTFLTKGFILYATFIRT